MDRNILLSVLSLLIYKSAFQCHHFVLGARDQFCISNRCKCCIDGECGEFKGIPDGCPSRCIDGHRGARCYELCENNCKTCPVNASTCDTCYDGFFLAQNKRCINCPTNCKTCTSSTMCGSCKDGFENRDGSTACEYPQCPGNCVCNKSNCIGCVNGYFDTENSCNRTCPDQCSTCSSLQNCSKCQDRYYNGYTNINGNNIMLKNCTHKCRKSCVRCSSYERCLQCSEGKYGLDCQDNCSIGCKGNTCLIDTGSCNCSSKFEGDKCNDCVIGHYGNFCDKPCPEHCKNDVCDRSFGNCSEGCKTSNFAGYNCDTCILGKRGELCNESCPLNCKSNKCEKHSGECSEGCVGAFSGSRCTECQSGKYGDDCELECPDKCLNDECNKQSGNCLNCTGNFDGEKCNLCKPRFYGRECSKTCSNNCLNVTCNIYDGECDGGCKDEFSGDKCCIKAKHCKTCLSNFECQECTAGYFGRFCNTSCPQNCIGSCDFITGQCTDCQNNHFGDFCNSTCSINCNASLNLNESRCNSADGECIFGCKNGHFGLTCNETCSGYCIGNMCRQKDGVCIKGCDIQRDDPACQRLGQTDRPTTSTSIAGPVAGGVSALVVFAAGAIVAVVFFKRRRLRKNNSDSRLGSVKKSSKRQTEIAGTAEESHVYANIRGNKPTNNQPNIEAAEVDVEEVVIDDKRDQESDDGADYYNYSPDNMNVKVTNLFSYVTRDHVALFEREFKNLPKPDDLSKVCKVARKSENIALNRYNGIYPFDHSRVTIPGQPRFFINACYIDGYNRKKAYIASFGPTAKTTDTFSTFWRMVWHERSDIIVMLTNLREPSGMKCEQYWPEADTEEQYGHVNVKCRSVEVFAEYTIMILTISKGKEQRSLTHLHYTAWPDKGVPSEVASLVEFRQRVKAVPEVSDGPVIVHCSAGVGRTGTYIALDMLTEEGRAEESVDVFSCVSKLREQRVNMVQTTEQYIFLHKALVHSLTFECEAITAEGIQRLTFEGEDMFTKIFQTLKQEVDTETEEEQAVREEIRTRHTDKSRRHSDIPGDLGRVRLFLRRSTGDHDYINAVFINSFKIKNLFIAAQSPLPGTAEDFLCMIYQYHSSCVVSLESSLQSLKKNDVGKYLPADNETYRCGEFTVTSSKCETKPQYILKKLTIQNAEKGEEKVVYHFQYTKWGNGQTVADSAEDFVQFVKCVEKYVNQKVGDTPNIVVHCLNGYERSGLFCVVYTLLEKLEAERQVSVVNTVRKVRAQRKRSISTTEQLKFCYQCISAYLDSYNTYSNFAM